MSHEFRARMEHHGAGHVHQLIERLRLIPLVKRFPARVIIATYVFINSFITIVLISLVAVFTSNSFVFPSLGPTAYLFFFQPMNKASSPRHAICGHAIGLICGYFAYALIGIYAPGGLNAGLHWQTGLAAAISLALTGAFMVFFRVSHPPAGATTLIVSLGLLSKPSDLLIIEAAVVLLTLQAFIINRLAGLPYPLWESKPGTHEH